MKVRGHDVYLVDDGTLDTVVSVDGWECRFSECDREENGELSMTKAGVPFVFYEAVQAYEEKHRK